MEIKRRPLEEISFRGLSFRALDNEYWPLRVGLCVYSHGSNISINGFENINKEETIALRDALTEIIEQLKEQS